LGYELDDSIVFKVVEGLLERFNFTISEDTPFDVDVAVDPEMPGKVYESLIQEEERGEGEYSTHLVLKWISCAGNLFWSM
jgi:hypothetical protein